MSGLWRPYEFVDEWDVAAPPASVFAVLDDATSYPLWWRPVYHEASSDATRGVGSVSRQHFQGRLPYHLRTMTRTTVHDPPHVLEGEVTGDLRGRGRWTLTPTAAGTHLRFDWTVHADRLLLRVLTPFLRPVLRWNHTWAIARAMEGLEPYVLSAARTPAAAPPPR
jgi:uncharacterized protein YndB with AHSA1/START domain